MRILEIKMENVGAYSVPNGNTTFVLSKLEGIKYKLEKFNAQGLSFTATSCTCWLFSFSRCGVKQLSHKNTQSIV